MAAKHTNAERAGQRTDAERESDRRYWERATNPQVVELLESFTNAELHEILGRELLERAKGGA